MLKSLILGIHNNELLDIVNVVNNLVAIKGPDKGIKDLHYTLDNLKLLSKLSDLSTDELLILTGNGVKEIITKFESDDREKLYTSLLKFHGCNNVFTSDGSPICVISHEDIDDEYAIINNSAVKPESVKMLLSSNKPKDLHGLPIDNKRANELEIASATKTSYYDIMNNFDEASDKVNNEVKVNKKLFKEVCTDNVCSITNLTFPPMVRQNAIDLSSIEDLEKLEFIDDLASEDNNSIENLNDDEDNDEDDVIF